MSVRDADAAGEAAMNMDTRHASTAAGRRYIMLGKRTGMEVSDVSFEGAGRFELFFEE